MNEGLFKVCVDHTGRLRCLSSVSDGPLSHLVRADCEEGAKVQNLAHRNDDLGQCRVGADVLALLESSCLSLELSQALLEGHGNRDDRVTCGVLLAPLSDLGQVLVLFPDVILLRKIDQIDDGLGAEQEERVDDLNLFT